jgi:hypothetical protein
MHDRRLGKLNYADGVRVPDKVAGNSLQRDPVQTDGA